MKKKIIITVLGGVMIIFGLFAAAGWVLFTGAGFVAEKAPGLVEDGKRLATEVLRRTQEAMPGISEKMGSMLPGEDVPEQDVGGEDIPGVNNFSLVGPSYVLVIY